MPETRTLEGRPAPWLLAGAALLSVCGCASVRPLDTSVSITGVDVPSSWSVTQARGAGDSTAVSRALPWWQRFDDPLLDRLVTQSLQANTSVESARSALMQAQALRDVAAAALWPTVGSSASAQRGMAGGHGSGSILQVGVDANWVPDVFGANRSALRAGDALVQAGSADLGAMQLTIAAEVGLGYIQLRSAQVRLAIARDNLASEMQTLQITRWRLQAGLASTLDVEQARAAAEQTRALLPAYQLGIDQARHGLAVLGGVPPAALDAALAAPGPVPWSGDGFVPDLPAETLRQRADVRAAEYRVAAAWARVAQADAARFPGFSLGGSLGASASGLAGLARRTSLVGALLASVDWPLFDAGAAQAQVRAQQAAFEQARLAYRATVLGALQQVEDALAELGSDRIRLRSLRAAADATLAAADLAAEQFSSGLVDFQTVLLAQRARLATQDSVASTSADLASDQVRLVEALGGGWHADEDKLASDSAPSADLTPAR